SLVTRKFGGKNHFHYYLCHQLHGDGMEISMADVFTEQERSNIMKKVHSSGNKSTELKLIKLMRENGITGWRRNYKVKGHPDFVFLSKKIAIFVDGCFWHGHDCRNTKPSSHSDYWQKKRERNI